MKRVKELEAKIAELEEQLSRSITWCIADFEGQAVERETNGILLYDRSKFEDALSDMIRHHDATLGISWTTVDCYLDECAYSEQKLIARELTKLTGIEDIYDWNESDIDDGVELYDKDDNEIGKTTSEALTKAMNVLEEIGAI